MNSFQIHIKFDDNIGKFKLNVFAIDEYINLSNFTQLQNISRREYKLSNSLIKIHVDDKSNYSLFRKITKLFEERLNFLNKFVSQKTNIKKSKQVLLLFLVNLYLFILVVA